MSKELTRYVFPSVGAMLFNALYVVVDGIFVAKGVGDLALAAVNLAMPSLGVLAAIAVMLVMGGTTIAAVSIGRNCKEHANAVFSNCFLVTSILSIIFSSAALFFAEDIALLSGAEGQLLKLTATYLRSYLSFGFFFTISYLFSAFVRNDGNPTLAFFGMAAGTVCNIFLDWLFIYPLGMGILGAGLASGLSMVLSFCILLFHFILKKGDIRISRPKFSKSITVETIKRGFPEFVTQMWSPVLTYCYNIIILGIHGETGVSAFSMIGYLLYIQVAISSGIVQGVQPLISRRYGEENHQEEHFFFKSGLIINIIVTLILYAATLFAGKVGYQIFSDDTKLINLAYHGTIFIGIGMLIAAVNMSYSGYFLATQRTKQALLLAISRAFVFTAPFVMLTPMVFGDAYVWCGIIGSELCVAVLAVILYSRLPNYGQQ